MGIFLQGNALLGLLAAGIWGMGDFSGGMGVKRAGGSTGAALRVVLMSHTASFSVLLAISLIRGDRFPHGAVLAWGLAAGVAGGLSLTAFYIALSRGAMGAAAAISGLLAAAIPAAVDMLSEGTPGWRRTAGFVIAGVAIWLVAGGSSEPNSTPQPSGTMLLAILAGAGFGCYFVALKFAGAGGLIWPMATARIGSITTCSLLLLASLFSRNPPPPARITPVVVRWALSTALLDTTGNLLFIAATRAGRLDVAAVLASLYPASTILLAALLLKEKPTHLQAIGMVTAVVAVVMIAL
ncbi:EamA family transporter [Granulicella sp. WH15]|uniref:EamA family transporter n=1 Tax=Granulicella sp. WH15 TaxID=2602070 RepID=UPI00136750B8|nr:EamA family transporter [Granulicella sp. WH15]QHN04177.1 EamA family transporter [Granulicella sp. WH15]